MRPFLGFNPERRLFLWTWIITVIGLIGFLITGHGAAGYFFAHVGGLGILGIFATLSGYQARKKGYKYWTAWWWGLLFPAAIGIGSVILVHSLGGGGCGGIVSLTGTLIVFMVYSLIKPKE